MKVSELANRYARAIFEVSAENANQVAVLNELREVREAFDKNDKRGLAKARVLVCCNDKFK